MKRFQGMDGGNPPALAAELMADWDVPKRDQTQLANKINAKQKSISRYETGASMPSIATLVKIAKVLKKPAGEFLEE